MRALWTMMAAVDVVLAGPAAAQLRPLVSTPASADAARAGVEVYVLNEGTTALPATGPGELETVALDGTRLRLIPAQDDPQSVAPGGFARLHYRLAASYPVAVAEAPPAAVAGPVARSETPVPTSAGTSAAFVDRFRPYEPIYGAFGTGTDGAKLQFSFDFRALGRDDGPHLDFAYTQTMFWAIDRPSGPFRATTYSPEVFVELPVDATAALGLGYRHDSNGGGPATSVDANRLFVRASKAFALGGDWALTVSPRAWVFVGNHGIATDLERYWGNAGLSASLGQRDGVKLAVSGKGNVGSGRGLGEAFLSYPLVRVDDRLPRIYLFGQAFTGFGEALGDYDHRSTAARIGIALTR